MRGFTLMIIVIMMLIGIHDDSKNDHKLVWPKSDEPERSKALMWKKQKKENLTLQKSSFLISTKNLWHARKKRCVSTTTWNFSGTVTMHVFSEKMAYIGIMHRNRLLTRRRNHAQGIVYTFYGNISVSFIRIQHREHQQAWLLLGDGHN